MLIIPTLLYIVPQLLAASRFRLDNIGGDTEVPQHQAAANSSETRHDKAGVGLVKTARKT